MFSWFRRLSVPSGHVRLGRPRFRPELEALEMRLVPTLGPSFGIDASASDTDSVAVAMNAAGQRVAVYDHEITSNNRDIFAQRFDAAGAPVGGEITVSSASSYEYDPDVAMDALGNFVVTWTRSVGNGSLDIQFHTFDSAGNSIQSGFVDNNNADTSGGCVTMSAAGNWAVAFRAQALNGSDVFARRFDLNGKRLGNDIVVAANPLLSEDNPVIDGNASGRFAIAFRIGGSDTLVLKRYRSNGTLLGKAKVATEAFVSDVAVDKAGNATVVFAQFGSGGFDVFSRTVSAANVLGKRKVVANTSVDEFLPQIAMDRATGRYVVSYAEDGGVVQVAEFSKKGAKLAQHSTVDGDVGGSAVSFEAGSYFVGYLLNFLPGDDDVSGRIGTL